MAISIWGMMLVPGCEPYRKTPGENEFQNLDLNVIQEKNLESMVDTFIPKTDTLGAADLDIHHFINRLLANCYEKEVQVDFISGLDHLEVCSSERFDKSFHRCSQKDRETILLAVESNEEEEIKQFFDQAKELTILGYTTSEYYLSNFTNYNMVPGTYEGCVPVPEKPFKV